MQNKINPILFFFVFTLLSLLILASCSENKSSKRNLDNKSKTTQSENILSDTKKIIYIVSDMGIPFWKIMAKGIENNSKLLGYELEVYDAKNNAKHELELTAKALKQDIAGLIISPTNSSASVTILNFFAFPPGLSGCVLFASFKYAFFKLRSS